MTSKTIVMQREVKGRMHTATLRRHVHMHVDIIDALVARCIALNVNVDVDALMDNVVDRY